MMQMENLLDIEVTDYATIIEEKELICCMTGFRTRVLVAYLSDGASRSIEVPPLLVHPRSLGSSPR